MQEENKLYTILRNYVPVEKVKRKNTARSWEYGYNEEHDMVVISKTGQIGDIYLISGLVVAIPPAPEEVHSRDDSPSLQYWERVDIPKVLSKIKNMAHWNSMGPEFKRQWTPYIDREFDRRADGFWFMNNGKPTYITGSHYFYMQWSSIDVGYPDFREANRIFYIFWEACKADDRSFGICYLKIRRSGFSFMGSEECVNIGTQAKESRVGILSKTGPDAAKMFTGKVVPINSKLPFFFRPVMNGMDKPKTELSYAVPASKITKSNMNSVSMEDNNDGLNTSIDWRNTDENSYDGEKLILLIHDEAAKWLKPNNIKGSWRVTKTCLRLGSRIVGKCMMGSTANALSKGGQNYKDLYGDSDVSKRNANGQTKSGLYALFIPMEANMEGFIDRYGMPVLRKPASPIMGVDGRNITNGALDYWEAEVESLKNDPDALNEFYRQFPRTTSHAFRDESKQSLFNLTKIYQQIDYNDSLIKEQVLKRGYFHWKNGEKDTEVVWTDDRNGRFLISWLPPKHMRNNVINRNGVKYPGNEHVGCFGCDPYDISAVVGGRGSNGSLHGLTKMHMDEAPCNEFFLEYIARPQTAEIFFEEVLMACIFYGMPILVENNKPRLLYHIKNRGYRGFSMNRPDRTFSKLSKTEIELGGIPNSSEDVMQSHAAAIESYIEKYVGYDQASTYRPSDEMGRMLFSKTLENWARFDINNRTMFDASISSGLAIMGTQKHLYTPQKEKSKIRITFAKYNNTGVTSELIKHE